MNEPLSPSAQAVLDAATVPTGDFCLENVNEIAAAALEAAAAQVEPDDGVSSEVRRVLDRLLAIAAELLERPTPQPAAPPAPQPVAKGPTDDEIEEWADACSEAPLEEMDPEVHGWRRCFTAKEFSETIRAALARWGRPTPQPETNAFAIVQQRLEQLAGDQELMIYRWPLREDWDIEHTNPSSSVQLGEVSGEYGCTGRTLEEAVCKLAELLPTPEATNE